MSWSVEFHIFIPSENSYSEKGQTSQQRTIHRCSAGSDRSGTCLQVTGIMGENLTSETICLTNAQNTATPLQSTFVVIIEYSITITPVVMNFIVSLYLISQFLLLGVPGAAGVVARQPVEEAGRGESGHV